jgi:transposase
MPRHPPYPPYNHQCLYKDNCPHLEGLSTKWVFNEYQRSRDEYVEHWRVRDILQERIRKSYEYIGKLEKENEELKAKLQILHRRQFKANKKTPKTPDKKSDKTTKKKKRGPPKGHTGWHRRKPGHIDKSVIVEAPEKCPHCLGTDLKPVDEIKSHLQEDIILCPRTYVINYLHHQSFCPDCNRNVIQAAEGELLNCQIGPTTKAAAVFLRYGIGIPYRKVQDLFKIFFNMPFVPASAMAFDRKATHNGEALYEDLKEKVRASMIAHADETSWREDGINHFVWYAGNEDLAYFHINRHRSSEVAQSILGTDFRGILNSDGYAAYNGVKPKARQACLAHLIRNAKEIKQEILLKPKRYQDKQAVTFCDAIVNLFKKACEIGQKFINGEIPWECADIFKKRFYSAINSITISRLNTEKAENFRLRLLDPKKEYNRLFTFLKYPNVQPTNNQAEQSLRNIVIFRKICFGTRSPEGSHSHSVLPSLLLTAKRQGQHPLNFFKTLFLEDTAIAQNALYYNSS